ncbi:MAG: methyltransferase [Planctomycetota bacterium]
MSGESSNAEIGFKELARAQWAFGETFALLAAAEIGVFPALGDGACTIERLAERLDCSQRGLRFLLEALAGMRFLTRDGERFGLARGVGPLLVEPCEGGSSEGGPLLHLRMVMERWMELTAAVRSGKPVRKGGGAASAAFFRTLVPDLYRINQGAARVAAETLKPSLPRFDAAALDVAAGSGVFGIELARAHGGVVVTALDHGEVLEVTRQFVERNDMAARFHYLPGDLRTVELAEGLFDVVFLGHILHSEGAAWSRTLLKRIGKALRPGGSVVIAEFLVDAARSGPLIPLLFGLNMLVHTEEGDVFSMEQIGEWLAEAGFGPPRLLEVPDRSPLILAEKRSGG